MTATQPKSSTPTVVLVHGAFGDASGWAGVIKELDAAGVNVVAPPNLLRGLISDAAYITSFVKQLGGRTILVGHSYGGAVITQAGADAGNVAGLVYVNAFGPDAKESLGAIGARYADRGLGPALRQLTYPTGGDPAVELYVDHDAFHEVICADVSADVARVLALTQRPVAASVFQEELTSTPAWKSLPSWAVISTGDHAINPEAERDMAQRANAETVETNGAHFIMVSQPSAVAELILRGVKATS
jgi:pimeloyl-ACP methyl ester carboxylesterase